MCEEDDLRLSTGVIPRTNAAHVNWSGHLPLLDRVPTTRGGCHLGEEIMPPVRGTVHAYAVLEELALGLTPVGTRPWVFSDNENPT